MSLDDQNTFEIEGIEPSPTFIAEEAMERDHRRAMRWRGAMPWVTVGAVLGFILIGGIFAAWLAQ